MSEPKRLTGIVYGDGSIEAFRNRDDPHEETWEVSDDEAADTSAHRTNTSAPPRNTDRAHDTPRELN